MSGTRRAIGERDSLCVPPCSTSICRKRKKARAPNRKHKTTNGRSIPGSSIKHKERIVPFSQTLYPLFILSLDNDYVFARKALLLTIMVIFFGFINVFARYAVFVSAFGASPNILMVIKPGLTIQIGITSVAIPVCVWKSISHDNPPFQIIYQRTLCYP